MCACWSEAHTLVPSEVSTFIMLTEEQKAFYKENGYIKLDNVFTPEEIDEICEEYALLYNMKFSEDMETSWKGDKITEAAKNKTDVKVLAFHNLQFHSEVFTRMITNKNIVDAAADIMGPNVLLHHVKSHVKPPEKGAPYLMHQDYHYFPFKNDSLIAVFIHLDDSTPENGCLCVYPGSHKLGPLEDKGILEGRHQNGETYHWIDQDKFPLSGATPMPAKKGEVVIFSYLLIHGSYLNVSNRVRRMILIQLMSDDDDPLIDTHKSYGQGLVLRGRNNYRDASMQSRFVSH